MRDRVADVELLEPRFALSAVGEESSIVQAQGETSFGLHDALESRDTHVTAETRGNQVVVHLPEGEHVWCLYQTHNGRPVREEQKGDSPVQGDFFCDIPAHPGKYQLVFSAGQSAMYISFTVIESGEVYISRIAGPENMLAIPSRGLPLPTRTDPPGITTLPVQAHDDIAYPDSTQKSSGENPPSKPDGNVRPVKATSEDLYAPLNSSPLKIPLDDLGADNPRKTKLPVLMVFNLELELKARMDRVVGDGDIIGAIDGLPAEIYGRTLRELQEARLRFGLGYGPDEIRENYHKEVEEILRRALIQSIWQQQHKNDKRDTRPIGGPPPAIGMNDSDKVFADSDALFTSLDGEKAGDPALVTATASVSLAQVAALFSPHSSPEKRRRVA